MNRKEKQQLRIECYEALASKAEDASAAAFRKSQDVVSGIPFGQPILVGHHSERAHRRALDNSMNAMRKSVEASEKAEYYHRKAEAAANNDAIYTEDDDAEERLKAKIAKLERLQELMKSSNKVFGIRNFPMPKRRNNCKVWASLKNRPCSSSNRIMRAGSDSRRSS